MRVAAFQRFAIFDDVNAAVEAIDRGLAAADDRAVDLAIFPECFLQGHSYERALVERRALAIDDPRLLAMLTNLSARRTAAIIGFFERRGEVLHNSAMLVEAGQVTGVYRKVNPFEDGCTPGLEFPVWHRAGSTFGISICSDLRRPDASAALVERGARLICCPLNMTLRREKAPHWREPALEALRSCARNNDAWVVSADVTGDGPEGWMSFGCTAVVAPGGIVMAQAKEGSEAMLIVDVG